MTDNGEVKEARKRIGRPPRITGTQIMEAAQKYTPESLTMSGLAADLGVDRKLLNYYVGGKEQLLHLIAQEALKAQVPELTIAPNAEWDEVIRTTAYSLREAAIATGQLVHFSSTYIAARSLAPVEASGAALLSAGFDRPTTAHALMMIVSLCIASARDALFDASPERHPQHPENREVFNQLETELPILHALQDTVPTFGLEQFQFNIDTVISGLRKRLSKTT